ncbi:MAG TPA: PD-(D/E)XK nuclease-like domain-containing protein [Nocardioides sp.]|nr:PD-(D/E)XK nuclease-like domain-containing protein [Nocardioides sp.]
MSDDIKPGLHFDLPNDDYHALTDWWSSTQLKRALPELYDEGSMSQAALDFGTLVHSVVLEPDNLSQYVAADAAVIGLKADGTKADNPTSTKAWKLFVAESESDGKVIVTQDDWERAHRMRDAILAHGEAAELLFSGDGLSEVSAFCTDEDGIQHKARFDRLVPDSVIDLKTTGSRPGEDSLTRTVIGFLYDLSASHYLDVADLLDLDVERFTWVFVGKTEPYRVTVADASKEFIERGRTLRDRALNRLCGDAEPYEGATGRLTLTPPPWARLSLPAAGIPADFEWSINDYA